MEGGGFFQAIRKTSEVSLKWVKKGKKCHRGLSMARTVCRKIGTDQRKEELADYRI